MIRSSGVLLHPTSLPGPGGIGTLGPAAFRFVDALRAAGQTFWQVLPLGPTGFGDSPYQAFSAFAGNPFLISAERLAEDGLLSHDAARGASPDAGSSDAVVDFGAVHARNPAMLESAHAAFLAGAGPPELHQAWDAFREEAKQWLPDYALFAALHEAELKPWVEWPKEVRDREPAALRDATSRLAAAITRISFGQFLFFRQWRALRRHAHDAGLSILGDIPLFVAHDSADVWLHRDIFDLDGDGRPNRLSGAPPDAFTDDGQLWGNPLYRWEVLEADGFAWWIRRARAALDMFDVVRLDHFRGLVACWTVPAGETSAKNGRWDPVPGEALLTTLRDALGGLPFVAEDLGAITPEVTALRDRFELPGMKILLFGFSGDPKENEYAPHNHEKNGVVYTGTHDNETVQGWFHDGVYSSIDRPREEADEERRRVLAYLGGDESSIHWSFVRAAFASVADVAIVPVQDLLGLGNEARMNLPGRLGGNWSWRLREGDWTEDLTARLLELTRATGRERTTAPSPAQ